jgi:tetratricopeptide (TPR) repeat protein
MVKLPNADNSSKVLHCYYLIAKVHDHLGDHIKNVNVLKTAFNLSVDRNNEEAQFCICLELLDKEVDENFYIDWLNNAVRLIKEKVKGPFLAIMHLKLATRHLKSGKHKDGLASLQEAFDIKLDNTMVCDVVIRESTVACYVEVAMNLLLTGKCKLAKKAVDRATKIAESLPEFIQHFSVFLCYVLTGRILNEMQEYDAAIDSLGHALLQHPKLSHDVIDKSAELECRLELAKAYWFKESYEKALTSHYDALSVVKDISPEGSEVEGDLYLAVAGIAAKMKNKTLVVNNLRLAYKMYSKILGRNHPTTEQCYIEYARALINC